MRNRGFILWYIFSYETLQRGFINYITHCVQHYCKGVGVHSPEIRHFSSFLNGHEWYKSKSLFFYSLVDSNFSLQWKVQARNNSEVMAPTRLLPDGNLKKDYFSDALLICSEQLVDVKPKIDPFLLILSSWILCVTTQSTCLNILQWNGCSFHSKLNQPFTFHLQKCKWR